MPSPVTNTSICSTHGAVLFALAPLSSRIRQAEQRRLVSIESCDLKWLTDSLAVNRANKAKKRECGGAAGSLTQPRQVFRKRYLICYTRASKQANLACDI